MIQDNEKLKFLNEINQNINALQLQHSRIHTQRTKVHDADFYMILLRRFYRKIEKNATSDSRVANLKGKYKNLCIKIKMRDDFEHGVKKDNQLEKKQLIDLGIINKKFSGTVQIQISVLKNSIVSGNIRWNLTKDHQTFVKMMKEFVSLLSV